MSSENKDYFTLAFPIRMYFISFSGLNVLTRIYNTTLTAIGQSEKPCFSQSYVENITFIIKYVVACRCPLSS